MPEYKHPAEDSLRAVLSHRRNELRILKEDVLDKFGHELGADLIKVEPVCAAEPHASLYEQLVAEGRNISVTTSTIKERLSTIA